MQHHCLHPRLDSPKRISAKIKKNYRDVNTQLILIRAEIPSSTNRINNCAKQHRVMCKPQAIIMQRISAWIFTEKTDYTSFIIENLHSTRGITPKRVTSGGIHLRDLASGQHSSEETSLRWRTVKDCGLPTTQPCIIAHMQLVIINTETRSKSTLQAQHLLLVLLIREYCLTKFSFWSEKLVSFLLV